MTVVCQVLSAATVIAKHTSALCNACRVASSKTANPVAKRHFVQSAKDVANSTANLVKEIKGIILMIDFFPSKTYFMYKHCLLLLVLYVYLIIHLKIELANVSYSKVLLKCKNVDDFSLTQITN